MKKHLSLITCTLGLFLFTACGVTLQTVEVDPVSQVIQSDTAKDELFINANIWLVESFKSAKDVIQFSDKEAGIVIGKYLLQGPVLKNNTPDPNPEGIYAIIKIQTKDGATRITVVPETFFKFPNTLHNSGSTYTREMAVKQINSLVQSYTAYVKYDQSNEW